MSICRSVPAWARVPLAVTTISMAMATAIAITACDARTPAVPPTVTTAPLPTLAVSARTSVAADGVLVLSAPPIPVSFELNSRVTGVFATPGQAVKQGDVLAVVDDTALLDAVADAAAQLALLEAQIEQSAGPAREEDIASAKAALAAAYAQYNILKTGPAPADIEQALRAWNASKESWQAAKMSRDAACGAGTDTPNCQSAEASLGNAYENERAAFGRYQALLQPVSKDKLTQAYAAVASAQARLDALQSGRTPEQQKLAKAQLDQAKASLARVQKNLAKARLTAPCDCTVQDVSVSAGSFPSGPAFTLLDLSGLRFKTTNLSERDLTAVKVGTPATVRLKAYDRAFTGKVGAILPLSEGGQGAQAAQAGGAAVFSVLIALDPIDADAGMALLPGMTGQAEITVR